MIDREVSFAADPLALRAEIQVRIVVLALAALLLAFVATSVPVGVTVILAIALAVCAIAAFPPALLDMASGREALLKLGPDGFTYRLYGDKRILWADIDTATLEIISEEQPNRRLPARRKLGQDRLKMTLKEAARDIWLRPIIVKPAYLAVDLEALVAAIETSSGRKIERTERLMPPSGP